MEATATADGPRVLLVEDEVDLALPVRRYLESLGFRVALETTARGGLAAVRDGVDLVLLDVMLPDASGIDVCATLRTDPATAAVPILLLTARTDEWDRISGFEAGADDYVAKPANLRELGLRVAALLRRSRPAGGAEPPAARVRAGSLEIDATAHQAWLDGAPLALTAVEFRLLQTLVENPGAAMSREELCALTWGARHVISDRAVDTNVKRLRKKLGPCGARLETVRSIGYRWADP